MEKQDPHPILESLPPGKHAICACGATAKPPFCDGAHAGTDKRPLIIDVGPTGETMAWCTCEKSGKLPRCDGYHKRLWANPLPPKQG